MSTPDQIFYDLPMALVDELLKRCDTVGDGLYKGFKNIQEKRDYIREELKNQGKLQKDTDLIQEPYYPTCCGIDGAYALQRLISTDIAAVAAVAVEGLTPPKETTKWPGPQHIPEIQAVPHHGSTRNILSALMMCMELELATKAPHDIVMLDGSMTSPLISVNQALGSMDDSPDSLNLLLDIRVRDAVSSIIKIVTSQTSDKIYVSIPKYTTRKDVSANIPTLSGFEDRGLLTLILEPGEIVGPIPKPVKTRPGNIANLSNEYRDKVRKYMDAIEDIEILYYRPFEHTPALRIETSRSVTSDKNRLSALLESFRLQCESPSIYEPYPLYLADRMVKHLSSVIPALRRTTTQYIAERWNGPIGAPYMAMHGYRTESG